MPIQEHMHQIGVVLLTQSMYAVVIFAVVAGLARAVRRRGAALQVALWSLVLLRFVVPPTWTHPFGLGALSDRFLAGIGRASVAEGVGGAVFGEIPPSASGPARSARTAQYPTAQSVFCAIWLVGAALVGWREVRRLVAVRNVLRAARPVDDTGILGLAEIWRRRMGIRRRVRLVSSDEGLAPCTAGWLRPVVFVPAVLLGDHERLETVLAHEMAHVARWDALWLGVQRAVHVAYFFHPAVWIAGAKVRDAVEELCDERALGVGRISPGLYAHTLLDVVGLELRPAGGLNLTTRKRRFAMRLGNILIFPHRRPARTASAVAAACVIGIFVLPLAHGRAEALRQPQETYAAPAREPDVTMTNPVAEGRVTWGWGPGRDPFSGEEVFHRGVDVAAAAGTPLHAPAAGTVVVATEDYEPQPGAGTVVIIDHGQGIQTSFFHLGRVLVRTGKHVTGGQVIAEIGSSGRSTGPHVHVEVHVDGEAVDPATFVGAWRQRTEVK
jgi:murein DD-endopeptidase MepM/ murein hydrolase activator NlpD